MNDSFTKEQVLEAYNGAPSFVRAAFSDPATTDMVVNLQARYKLHIDSAGMLGKEVGYLLLGLTNPTQFVTRLKNARLEDTVVNEIVSEINKKIFLPLQQKMRSGGGAQKGAASVPVPSYAPPRPPTPVPTPQPRPTPPPAQMSRQVSFNTPPPPTPPKPVMPQQPSAPAQVAPSLGELVRAASASVVPPPAPRPASTMAPLPPKTTLPHPANAPAVRMPLRPMLPVGEEEPAYIPAPPRILNNPAAGKLSVNLLNPEHRPAPPVNLPGTLSGMPRIERNHGLNLPLKRPAPEAPELPPLSKTPAPPSHQPYATDPYREPTE